MNHASASIFQQIVVQCLDPVTSSALPSVSENRELSILVAAERCQSCVGVAPDNRFAVDLTNFSPNRWYQVYLLSHGKRENHFVIVFVAFNLS
jgi:hypothetical protein